MELVINRGDPTQHSTPGELTGIESLTFQTLEPPPIPDPDYDDCPVSIPAGRYRLLMQPSVRWSQTLGTPTNVPVFQNVPGRTPYHPHPFTSVEIHPGNQIEEPSSTKTHPIFESDGCILAGDTRLNADTILGTRDACLGHIWPAIQQAQSGGEEVWITVNDAIGA